jgi:hypothetical protein
MHGLVRVRDLAVGWDSSDSLSNLLSKSILPVRCAILLSACRYALVLVIPTYSQLCASNLLAITAAHCISTTCLPEALHVLYLLVEKLVVDYTA